jgi:hypothetical protein
MPLRSFLLLAALAGAPAAAQHAPVDCVSVSDSNLPPAFAGWAKPSTAAQAATAAAAAAGPALPELAPDQPLALQLRPAAEVMLPHPPGQARTIENAHGGLVTVRIPAEGLWRISASAPVRIDLIGPSGPVASTGHGRMAPCTGIRKVVEFPVPAGSWLVQLNGNPGPELRLMLSRAP